MRFNNFLTLILFFLILTVFLKIFIRLLPVIIIAGAVFYLIKRLKKPQNKANHNGTIYRQCRYCKKTAEIDATECDFCGRPLE